MGHGEDHMKIAGGKKFLLSLSDPAFPRLCLALGTVPVPAGVVGDSPALASWTRIEVSTQSCGAAVLNGAEGLDLLIVETRFVPFKKATALRAEDVGHLHGWPTHPCSLRFLWSLAFKSESWSFASGFAAACRCSRER